MKKVVIELNGISEAVYDRLCLAGVSTTAELTDVLDEEERYVLRALRQLQAFGLIAVRAHWSNPKGEYGWYVIDRQREVVL